MDSFSAENPLPIAIIGGGIAGLALAVPLARAEEGGAPIRVHVYEAASKFGEIGAGVAFGPNAQRVMDRLGIKHALDSAMGPNDQSEEKRNTWFDVRRADAALTTKDNFLFKMTGENAGTGAVHRADFLDTLIHAFPSEKASFNKRLASYSDPGGRTSPIELRFKDGSTANADVLIGCDGVKSRTRRCMFAKDSANPDEESKATRAKYSGWVAYRGVVPATLVEDVLGDSGQDLMWFGYGRHILHFPIRKGELINIVMFVRDREGKRAIGRDGPWTEEVPQSQILEDYKDFNDTCKKLVEAVAKPTVWGIFDIPELPWYAEGRVALSGDAVHATTPHQGAGAGQCVEDAFILTKLLTSPAILASRENIRLALEAYSHVRRPRASMVQRTSAEAGMLYEYQLPGVMDDLQKVEINMKGRMRWIWEWDGDTALQEALDFVAAAQTDKS